MEKISAISHSFNIDIATEYGIEESIILGNIVYWVMHNKANNLNMYDGYYWTYNSARAYSELYPYISKQKINRVLNRLEENGLILSGNYNKLAYDRTKWYTITEYAARLYGIDISNEHDSQPPMTQVTGLQESEVDYPKP